LSKEWDHYLFRLGDDPASIYLDLGIAATAPVVGLEASVRISVPLRVPAKNGMSTDEEFDDLIALEDHLVARLHGSDALYVGRLTTRGSRVFYFYASDEGALVQSANTAMLEKPAYAAQVGSEQDPDWSTYFKFLHPSPEELQSLQNRRLN
jgi:hypothetical protein